MKKFNNRPNIEHNINGNIVWESRSVAINLVIINYVDDNIYVLASKRGPNAADFQGKMNIIAGYMDWDESGKEAVFRETWEEVGIDLEKLIKKEIIIKRHIEQPWYVKTDPHTSNKQNISLRYGIIFVMDKLPKLTVENNEIEGEVDSPIWLPLKEIDNYEWAFNHDQVIKDYFNL